MNVKGLTITLNLSKEKISETEYTLDDFDGYKGVLGELIKQNKPLVFECKTRMELLEKKTYLSFINPDLGKIDLVHINVGEVKLLFGGYKYFKDITPIKNAAALLEDNDNIPINVNEILEIHYLPAVFDSLIMNGVPYIPDLVFKFSGDIPTRLLESGSINSKEEPQEYKRVTGLMEGYSLVELVISAAKHGMTNMIKCLFMKQIDSKLVDLTFHTLAKYGHIKELIDLSEKLKDLFQGQESNYVRINQYLTPGIIDCCLINSLKGALYSYDEISALELARHISKMDISKEGQGFYDSNLIITAERGFINVIDILLSTYKGLVKLQDLDKIALNNSQMDLCDHIMLKSISKK